MNPYEVLGLAEGASPEEITRAYKETMAYYATAEGDFSQEMAALDSAYDALMYSGQSTYRAESTHSIKYGDIRAKMRQERFEDAETILDGIPSAQRDAEWYYLKGKILHSRGWMEEAIDCYAKAVQYEPNNPEYTQAYESVKHKQSGEFRNDWRQSNEQNSGCTGSICKLCTALACCDCLCSFFR